MKMKVGNINLLPRQYRDSRRARIYGYIGTGILLLEIIGFIGLVVIPTQRELKTTSNELLSKQKGIEDERYTKVNELSGDIMTIKKDLQTWLTCYENMEKKTFIGGVLLDELTARIPEGLILSSILIEEGVPQQEGQYVQQISLSGKAKAPTYVMAYLNIMETLFHEDTISHTLAKDSETGESIFTFNIELKEPTRTQQPKEASEKLEQALVNKSLEEEGERVDAGQ